MTSFHRWCHGRFALLKALYSFACSSPPLPPPTGPSPLSHSEEPDPFLTYTLHSPPPSSPSNKGMWGYHFSNQLLPLLSSSLLSAVVHLADEATFHTFSDVDFSEVSLTSCTKHVHTGSSICNVHFSQYSCVCCLLCVRFSLLSLATLFLRMSFTCFPFPHDSTPCSSYTDTACCLMIQLIQHSNVTKYIYSSTVLKYNFDLPVFPFLAALYFHSSNFGGKYCTFYCTTVIW